MKSLYRFPLLCLLFCLSFSAMAVDRHKLDSLQTALNKADNDSLRSEILRQISYVYDDAGDPQTYTNYLEQALVFSKKANDKNGTLGLLIELCQRYIFDGRDSLFFARMNEGDGLAKELKSEENFGVLQYVWSRYYKERGEFAKAITSGLNCIRILENVHNVFQLSNSLTNMGNLYSSIEQPQKALTYYKRAYAIDTAAHDESLMISDLNNIGMVYSDLGQFDESVFYLKAAIEKKKKSGNDSWTAGSMNTLGSVYVQMGKYEEALDEFFQAFKYKEAAGEHKGMAISCINIGETYNLQKKFMEATVYLNQAIQHATIIHNRDIIKESYKDLSNAYAGMNKMGEALDYLKRYNALKDTIFNENSSRQIAEMQTKYETEKKEEENKLLQARNEASEGTIRQQRLVAIVITVGLVLTLFLAFFIFRGYRQKQRANELISQQKEEVEKQKLLLEIKNKEVLDSIHYAKRIQSALLSSDNYLKKILPEHFILYKPKDIVSGDFYWSMRQGNKVYIAAADCTGHGVPGAFMSLVGISFLNEILSEKRIGSPEKILDQLRVEVIRALNPEDASEESKDGMDIVLLCYDTETKLLQFAGANNPLYLIRNGELQEFRTDKFPVGKYHGDMEPFALQTLPLLPNDLIYIFTDGYADQFGGPKGKKFKYKQLQEVLLANHTNSLPQQKMLLETSLENWKGNLEQIDDILIIGLKL